MVAHDAESIGLAATQFLFDIFKLPGACAHDLGELLTSRLIPKWNKDSPRKGSCNRALLFPYGKFDLDFDVICKKLGLLGSIEKARKQFPHEFTLFQDPDGCEVEFSWGLRCRDVESISLYPRNEWTSYSEDLLKRKVQKSTKVTSKKLDTFAVAGADIIWNEAVVNTPDISSESDSDRSSPSTSRGPSPDAEKLFHPAHVQRSFSPQISTLHNTSQSNAPTLRPVLGSHSPALSSSQLYTAPPSTQPISTLTQSYTTMPAAMPAGHISGMSAGHISGMPGSMFASSTATHAARSSPVIFGQPASAAYGSAGSMQQYSASTFNDSMLFQPTDNMSIPAHSYRDLGSAVSLMA